MYPAIDDSSGDEEEQADRLVKRGLPDGVFSLRQLFSSGTEFKKNVIRYILKTWRNLIDGRRLSLVQSVMKIILDGGYVAQLKNRLANGWLRYMKMSINVIMWVGASLSRAMLLLICFLKR